VDTRAARDSSDVVSRETKQADNRRLFSAFCCPAGMLRL